MHKENEEDLDKAPLFGSWNKIYGFVMVFFVIVVALFYWFTVSFS